MNRLRAAIAVLALAATPAPAETAKDYIDLLTRCAERGRLNDCVDEHFRRTYPESFRPKTPAPAVPVPVPTPRPLSAPREWRI